MENIGHLSAAILYAAFEDLGDENRTKYIYPQFFFSDLCKNFFALSGVVYDRDKITKLIDRRPRPSVMFDAETYTQNISVKNAEEGTRYTYTFEVQNGYITKISRKGVVYRLKRTHDIKDTECNYIADVALDNLRSGKYCLVEGV